MIHLFHVECKCGESHDEHYNHSQGKLVKAIKVGVEFIDNHKKNGWTYYLDEVFWSSNGCEIVFRSLLVWMFCHLEHGGFIVKGVFDSDQPIEIPVGNLEQRQKATLEQVAKEWLETRNIIADYLQEIIVGYSRETANQNSAAIIARLANHEPPIITRYADPA